MNPNPTATFRRTPFGSAPYTQRSLKLGFLVAVSGQDAVEIGAVGQAPSLAVAAVPLNLLETGVLKPGGESVYQASAEAVDLNGDASIAGEQIGERSVLSDRMRIEQGVNNGQFGAEQKIDVLMGNLLVLPEHGRLEIMLSESEVRAINYLANVLPGRCSED